MGDINSLASYVPFLDVIERDQRFTLHHCPMLFTPKMFLITESFAWPHGQPFDFIRRGIQEHLPMSPGRASMMGAGFFTLQDLDIDLDVRFDHAVFGETPCDPVTA